MRQRVSMVLGDGKRARALAGRVVCMIGATALIMAIGASGARAGDTPPDPVNAGGSNTTLPDTESAVTVAGRKSFAKMTFHINQTEELVNQAISVSWTGGKPTDSVTNVANNYVQIMQCWGDPITAADGTVGPDPRNCEFGGQSQKSWQGNVPGVRVSSDYRHYQDPDHDGDQVDVPFQAVDGTVVPEMFNGSFSAQDGGAWWLNPYFSYYSTNEIAYAPTYGDGTGNQLFTADTGLEAPGLGCGQAVQPVAGGDEKVPRCWLVIVPRSNYLAERGQQGSDLGPGVQGAPFQPRVWANRIAVPLEFKPLATSCTLGANERRIVGSELLAPAMSSWTPTLCAAAGSTPFNFAALSDTQARSQLTGAASGGAGMSIVSRPLDPAAVPAGSTVVYAPVALTGLVVGFNIERALDANLDAEGKIPDAERALQAQRVEHINLTPRLMAKLLSESYRSTFIGIPTSSDYDWARANPANLVHDPEFVAVNPEFQLLTSGSDTTTAGLVVELNSSDAAYEAWQWILSDPAAASWLAGNPDEHGMKVNPYYSTDPATNPSGEGLGAPLDNFPKNDPYSVKVSSYPTGFPALGMVDLMPYQNTLKAAALAARTTDIGAKTAYDPTIGGIGYQANGPQYQGSRFVLSLTDAASAAQYGLQTASLRNAAGKFVAPTEASLLAGEQAMTASAVPGVLSANPATTSPDAYPLTDLVYAATIPQRLDAGARKDFASLIRYVDQAGQASGVAFGQLPPGYAPLPAALRAQALTAATVIAAGGPAAPTSPPTPTTAASTTVPPTTGVSTTTPRTTPDRGSTTPPSTSTTVPTTTSTVSTPASTAASSPSPTTAPTTSSMPSTTGSTPGPPFSGQPDDSGNTPSNSGNSPGNGGGQQDPTNGSNTPGSTRPGAGKSTTAVKVTKSGARPTGVRTTSSPISTPTSGSETAPTATSSDVTPQLAAVRTPKDPVVAPVLPISLAVGLVAAILGPLIGRRRPRG